MCSYCLHLGLGAIHFHWGTSSANCFCYELIFLYCSMETITLGDKRIGIKTSVLEEKATACNMLCCYADELKEGFYPWIDQVSDNK